MRTTLILCFLSSLFIPPTISANDTNELATKLTTIIDAIPLKRLPPKYPINEARSGRDGWVVVSYVVEPDGSTSNMLIESSSGSKGFEKEARKAIKKWKFQPAFENGKAIQQCKNTVQLDYKMHREQDGVSKKFLRLYKKAQKVLQQEEISSSEEVFQKIEKWTQYTQLESFYKYTLLAQYQGKLANKKAQLSNLNQALRFTGLGIYLKSLKNEESIAANGVMLKKGLDKKEQIAKAQANTTTQKDNLYFPILHQKLMLEIEFNLIGSALTSIENLLLLKSSKSQHPSYKKQKVILENFVAGDKQLIVSANMQKNDFWRHKLLRNQFSFSDVVGQLTKVDLRCSNKRHVYTINETSTWKIPKHWKDCSIYVYGENNASFTLIELNEETIKNNTVARVNH